MNERHLQSNSEITQYRLRFLARPDLKEALRQFTTKEYRDNLEKHAGAFNLTSRIFVPVDESKTVDGHNSDRDFVNKMRRSVDNYRHVTIDFPIIPGVVSRQRQGDQGRKLEIDMRLDLGLAATDDILPYFQKRAENVMQFPDTGERLLVPVYYVAPFIAVDALAKNIQNLREVLLESRGRAGGIQVIETPPSRPTSSNVTRPISLPVNSTNHDTMLSAS